MLAALCSELVVGLLDGGVQDLVVSPGSRSTPLVLASLASPLRVHSVLDERSAGFFALGMARTNGQPVALLCTSGSAGAHYLPALLEARKSHWPLVAITADRPAELHHCGANQTIEQRSFFAAACARVVDVGSPDDRPAGSTRALVVRACRTSVATGSPTHINVALRKPLEYQPRPVHGSAEVEKRIPRVQATADDIELASRLCLGTERGVIVAGPRLGTESATQALFALARKTGFPLLAESTSGARQSPDEVGHRCDSIALLFDQDAPRQALQPELVITVGLEPASAGLLRIVDGARRRIHLTPFVEDENGATALRLIGDVTINLRALAEKLPERVDTRYRQALHAADALAAAIIQSELAASRSFSHLTEEAALATALASLPPTTLVTVGNSLVVRAMDWLRPPGGEELAVRHQRGLSGIDGLVAGASGSATLSSRPCALLLGDVSLAHDASSLMLAARSPVPLALLVIDNGGGRIFDHLPLAEIDLSRAQRTLWTTPLAVDLESIARGYGVAYEQPSDCEGIERAIGTALSTPGCTLVHMRVEGTSLRAFRDRVSARLDRAWPGSERGAA